MNASNVRQLEQISGCRADDLVNHLGMVAFAYSLNPELMTIVGFQDCSGRMGLIRENANI